MPSTPPLTIVIPVYNEGANFHALWGELTSSIKTPFTAIVVYDFDQDNTLPVAQEILASGETRIRLRKAMPMAAASPMPSRPDWKPLSRGRCW